MYLWLIIFISGKLFILALLFLKILKKLMSKKQIKVCAWYINLIIYHLKDISEGINPRLKIMLFSIYSAYYPENIWPATVKYDTF